MCSVISCCFSELSHPMKKSSPKDGVMSARVNAAPKGSHGITSPMSAALGVMGCAASLCCLSPSSLALCVGDDSLGLAAPRM